jgi:hypothetical protein
LNSTFMFMFASGILLSKHAMPYHAMHSNQPSPSTKIRPGRSLFLNARFVMGVLFNLSLSNATTVEKEDL